MKKLIAIIIATICILSVTVYAAELTPGASNTDVVTDIPTALYIGGDNVKVELTPGSGFAAVGASGEAFDSTDLTYKATSDKPSLLTAKLIAETVTGGKKLTLMLNPADRYATVETTDVEVKITVTQGDYAATATYDIAVSNQSHGTADFEVTEDGTVPVTELTRPVIDADVFGLADGGALKLDYGDYIVEFAKVSNQNTGLYLAAKTGTTDGAIASIEFVGTRVKDAVTVAMPIGGDAQNQYGEAVYVYSLIDGNPAGKPVEARIVNHNAVIFAVPAGSRLGAYAAYGVAEVAKAELPAIPETGANIDWSAILNIALTVLGIVAGFAVTYYKTNTKLQGKAAALIDEAEGMYTDSTKAGGRRFDWVVDQLYRLIPAALKPFISRDKVGDIVQAAFDWAQAFATKQLDKVTK